MASDIQRTYTAPCPGCGAPVEFRSAQSTHAVCSFCKSTVVRDGATLSRIGKMAEVFEDHSPLQLMAQGKREGKSFMLVGRLQYRGENGTWTEWIALFDDGTTNILAEDNGAYVFAQPASAQRDIPAAANFRVGASTAIAGKTFQITSNESVALVSAQGELPKLPPLNQPFAMIELRSAAGEVLAIDYGAFPPQVTRGRAVALEELQLSGLRGESTQESKGRQFSCPNCGAQVEVKLSGSKAITCRSCNAIIDLTQGMGGELRHAEQDEPVVPLIPLGSVGQLQGVQWQVVGYQHRMGKDRQDDEDESFGWDEYLLYNQKRGFSFLVDSTEGWSVVKPVTGAPAYDNGANSASYLGSKYELKYSYDAETNFVVGEFYWPVVRGQKTFNRDFAKGKSLLSLEETPRERTWSLGSQIDSDAVAKAFKLENKKELMKRTDAGPLSGGGGLGRALKRAVDDADDGGSDGIGCGQVILWIIIIIVVVIVERACDNDGSSSGFRSSGGSSGGYSSGGGHK